MKQSVALAWVADWALASIGLVISDAYSSPNRDLGAANGLTLAMLASPGKLTSQKG